MNAKEMYQEMILEYYRNPPNKGEIVDPDAEARDSNPSCGDIIQVHACIGGNKIKEIKFSGKGCVISQSAVSMLIEDMKGKDVQVVKALSKEDVLDLLGIEVSPVRMKCALLGLKVLKLAVYEYIGEKMVEELYEKSE